MAFPLSQFPFDVQTDPFSMSVRLKDRDGFSLNVTPEKWYDAQSHPNGRDQLIRFYLESKRQYELGREKAMVKQFDDYREAPHPWKPCQYPFPEKSKTHTPVKPNKNKKLILLCEEV